MKIRRIIRETCDRWGVTEEDLRSASRVSHLARARQEAYTRLRDETVLSYSAIGNLFDRHHTTIIYGERACRNRVREGLEP